MSSLGLAFTYFVFLSWHPAILIKSVPCFGYPSVNGFNYTVLVAVIVMVVAVITHMILTRVLKEKEEENCEKGKCKDHKKD